MEVEYSEAFKKQLKRLSRRYRKIRQDVQPIIDALLGSETPGDQITRTSYTLYKVRIKNSDNQRGKVVVIESFITSKQRRTASW